ncbi:S9 family peptidase [Nitrospirillum sp. BR 11828]|uniref:S9 family peptidase n=1 Tax=Nitrospirillum sp. BR 11828 TaxID=3104325 RepID=UPI002ACADAD7|nr:DPP IV N-terminal domain-containing protein [Nitrospirillum sp. BR 11828]MDZ5647875.1 DPP IV N-terminal domain-containing protein [Nitrospirillum sp. BR 11828]
MRRRSFIAALPAAAAAAHAVGARAAGQAAGTVAPSLVTGVSAPAAGLVPGEADYERALSLRDRWMGLTENVAWPAHWVGKSGGFLYRKTVPGGVQFVIVDAATLRKTPAFDHDRLAAELSKATGRSFTGLGLPFERAELSDNGQTLAFEWDEADWSCRLSDYACKQEPEEGGRRPRGFGVVRDLTQPGDTAPKRSPDGRWEALIQNQNLALREVGTGMVTPLSTDGSEGDFYDGETIAWSPDSRKLILYRVRPGYRREVHKVESSPKDQIEPKLHTQLYPKPGDAVDQEQPVLFHVPRAGTPGRQLAIDATLFPNPYLMTDFEWRPDSATVVFEYTRRGHQMVRVIEIEADTGTPRAVVTETATTFVNNERRFRHDVNKGGAEIIWLSERDGWSHLYLIDGRTGKVKTQITKGEWVVRHVARVDDERRQIYFAAGGMRPGEDPYFQHYYRVDFDGRNLVPLTTADAYHDVSLSGDLAYYVDTYSRIDQPPVMELRRTADRSLVAEIERGDITRLLAAGFRPPEVFKAKGRDGKTDIWGVIVRPLGFDPGRRYPVIENIYAGPHDSFVPKTFWPFGFHAGGDKVVGMQAQAEMGFVVAQIDGMGTMNRSKAFHDVCWKNLKDSGFPDRIKWWQAAAAQYPQLDISRVGIYGGSAGGQSSLAALLFFGDFYKAAFCYAGCHDNRMDKISWNEQWMGWPVDESYARSSNVDNAHRLTGQVALVVGELDDNVDPSSTMQVVNALIKADKTFDLLVVPGEGHSAGRSTGPIRYALRKQYGFFLKHLGGADAPDWNARTSTAAAVPPANGNG